VDTEYRPRPLVLLLWLSASVRGLAAKIRLVGRLHVPSSACSCNVFMSERHIYRLCGKWPVPSEI
jgi:hypothetical protein